MVVPATVTVTFWALALGGWDPAEATTAAPSPSITPCTTTPLPPADGDEGLPLPHPTAATSAATATHDNQALRFMTTSCPSLHPAYPCGPGRRVTGLTGVRGITYPAPVIGIVGAGAAGLATAIFAARRGAAGPIVVFEGAARPGAKILVSGGSRCNVTNAAVTEADFNGAPPHLVRRVLRAFGVAETVAFFRETGVPLHEEEHGKLFPDANRSRVVLHALLDEAARRGVLLRSGERVLAVEPRGAGFAVRTARGEIPAARVVLATGGLSLPKTGSDGHGLRMAESFGHSIIATTPALVPLVLAGSFHAPLSGVAHEVELVVRADGRTIDRRAGSLLWTHFGVSGPVVLDASRAWLRARLEGREAGLEVNLLPGRDLAAAEGDLVRLAASSPRVVVARALSRWLPASVADAVAREAGVAGTPLGRLRREERRALARDLVSRVLPVVESRGYGFAEATAGGVPLAEVDTRTMESRRRTGLFLVGEMLDVDGRIGGYNFQWAWSSAWVAAGGLSRGL
jgi:predicted Rossmann fold flavoprotein